MSGSTSPFTISNIAATSPAAAYAHQVQGIAAAHQAAALLSRNMLGVFAVSNGAGVPLAFYCNGQRTAAANAPKAVSRKRRAA